MSEALEVSCPATTANLGPGFDALGLALELRNRVRATPAEAWSVTASGPHARGIPVDPDAHLTVRAVRRTREALGCEGPPLRLEATIEIPAGRGLGSSATAIAAGVALAAREAGRSLEDPQVLAVASALEGHPDNVVPCLLGGFCVVAQEGDSVRVGRVEPAGWPRLVVGVPQEVQSATAEMRGRLPEAVPFGDAVHNVGAASLLVLALLQGREDLLGVALRDRLHEPVRGAAIPGWESVVEAARTAGALGVVISGSGPSLLAWVGAGARSEAVAEAMAEAWRGVGVDAVCRDVEPASRGTCVVSSRP